MGFIQCVYPMNGFIRCVYPMGLAEKYFIIFVVLHQHSIPVTLDPSNRTVPLIRTFIPDSCQRFRQLLSQWLYINVGYRYREMSGVLDYGWGNDIKVFQMFYFYKKNKRCNIYSTMDIFVFRGLQIPRGLFIFSSLLIFETTFPE